MDRNQDKLDNLHLGHVFFPPEVFLVSGSQGGHEVVSVHHQVDEGVQQGVERTKTSWYKSDPKPP